MLLTNLKLGMVSLPKFILVHSEFTTSGAAVHLHIPVALK